MRTALVVLLVCAATDLILCTLLLAVVWFIHRRQRRVAAAEGHPLPSASGQFAFLAGCGLVGFVVLYGAAWLLLRE